MIDRALKRLAQSIVWAIVVLAPAARGQEEQAGPPKKVLVELYTSQGCDSCPPASDLLGKFRRSVMAPIGSSRSTFTSTLSNNPGLIRTRTRRTAVANSSTTRCCTDTTSTSRR
jgi:hypothetical protein